MQTKQRTKIRLIIITLVLFAVGALSAAVGIVAIKHQRETLQKNPPFVSGRVVMQKNGATEPLPLMLIRLKTLPAETDDSDSEPYVEYYWDTTTDQNGNYMFRPVFPGIYRAEPVDLNNLYDFTPSYRDFNFTKKSAQGINFTAEDK